MQPDRTLTIVMYHYVRPLGRTRFPAIKGLDLDLFRAQVKWLRTRYTPVTAGQVFAALSGGEPLPSAALLMTFDDGYIDHYRYAYPILAEAGMSGVFFPPARAILERRLLAVNKIHFVLASTKDPASLVAELDRMLHERGLGAELPSLRERHHAPSRFDTADVIYVKRLLQHALPEAIRDEIVDRLFSSIVSSDEAAFAEELYLDVDQLRQMQRDGMHVGSHGYAHGWLNTMSAEEQEQDIVRSLELLEAVGVRREERIFCYPYGGYDANTLAVLSRLGFKLGVTSRPAVATLGFDPALELPRLDTNDFPKQPDVEPSEPTLALVKH